MARHLLEKKIVLERKLPPTGHIDGTGIKVVVNAVGVQGDIAATLQSDLENILLRNDPRLRTEDVHPDTIITCTVTSYAQPAPVRTQQQSVSLNNKKPAAPQYMERVTGTLTAGFKATSRSGHSLAADNVKANYGKAIDAKRTEKYFLEPQNRIDTALAHYKVLSEDAKTSHVESVSTHSASTKPVSSSPAPSSAAAADPPGDAMTNDQVIEMVAAHIDEGNIIDNIEHAPDLHFDLSVQGQVYLSQHGVNGRVLTAMKTRARSGSPSAHRADKLIIFLFRGASGLCDESCGA